MRALGTINLRFVIHNIVDVTKYVESGGCTTIGKDFKKIYL